ncbi:MAG TPA: GNAT family N-acetyltransferase [Acidimicrobiia bacterium]|jgi:GNAT superfamily N-acetyltransferase|nr:GNAT family N-acetyltransferase [Acidimicrobiia bacterium]
MDSCRPAERADLPRVAALARELRAELTALRGGEVWAAQDARPEPLEDAFAALLDDPEAIVRVGLIDEVVVGFGVLVLETLSTGELLGRVTELFVEPPARAIGVGEGIADDLVRFAADQDCIGVDALALPGHRATKNFFEEQGFTARALVMHRWLRDQQ